jgi:hypothetical protein
MAKRSGFDRDEHRGHALTKASATHLLNAGHLDEDHHAEIVKHAEKGMKAARKEREK